MLKQPLEKYWFTRQVFVVLLGLLSLALTVVAWRVQAGQTLRNPRPLVAAAQPVRAGSVPLLAAALPLPATLTVRNAGDGAANAANCPGADCRLRDAIAAAAAGDTIDFNLPPNSTIILNAGELVIDKNLTIQGPGANLLSISGNNSSRVFQIGLITTPIVSLSEVTITGGNTANSNFKFGGGIFNQGTLTVANSTVSSNTSENGGGIYNGRSLTIINSMLSGNTAGDSGGIYSDGSMTLTNSTVSGNTAGSVGGISSYAPLIITDSTISNNTATNTGGPGGIYCGIGFYKITNSKITGNTSSKNIGGGIYSRASGTIDSCTISGNTSSVGGGIALVGSLTITNSTISGNTAATGGGIYLLNSSPPTTLTLIQSTISNNTANHPDSGGRGGGISNFSGSVVVKSTIIAGNTVSGTNAQGPDLIGPFTSQGNNLIGKNNSSTGFSNGVNNDKVGTIAAPLDPRLAELANNGGPTETMALRGDSPALNAGGDVTTLNGAITGNATSLTLNSAVAFSVGSVLQIEAEQLTVTAAASNTLTVTRGANNTTAAPHADGTAVNPAFDQRGSGFPRKVGSAPDIGAFESDSAQTGPNFVVTTLNNFKDGICGIGHCSLRDAIDAANANADASTITFSVSGTIVLDVEDNHETGLPQPQTPITINGGGNITLSGNNERRIIRLPQNVTVQLNGLTFTNGKALNGGAIHSYLSDLTINNCTISGNTAMAAGGGIASESLSLTITNSTISNNSSGGDGGGGLINFLGSLTISNSTISGNRTEGFGGGIAAIAGTRNLSFVTITNNRSDTNEAGEGDFGGGIFGDASIRNSLITGNYFRNGSLASDCTGGITWTGSNLVGSEGNDCGCGTGEGRTTNPNTVANTLSALANNGGATLTHSLANYSPAQNLVAAGQCGVIGTETTTLAPDQRGTARPQFNQCDVGAVESTLPPNSAPVLSALAFTPSPVNVGQQTTLSGTATDMTPNGPLTLTIHWGDGSSNTVQTVTSGTPFSSNHTYLTANLFTATVTVSDGLLQDQKTLMLNVSCQTITVNNPTTTTGTARTFFNQQFTQTGGSGNVNFTTASTLPAGLTLAINGTLSGTPTQTGSFPLVVRATDANGCFGDSLTYTLVIGCQTISVNNPTTTTGALGVAFSQSFTQTGGIGNVSFTTTSPLPAGLTLASNGTLSGTPSQTGTFPITVTATDGNGCTGQSTTYTLAISCSNTTLVTSNADSGTGSLREVIARVCPGSTITFANNVTGEILLASGQLVIDKDLTIQGPGATVLTLRNTAASSPSSRVLHVSSGTVSITGLTFTGGNPNGTGFGCSGPTCGGGINNLGTLTLTECVVRANTISGDALGIGIFNQGTLNLYRSTVADNTNNTLSTSSGGGIYNNGTATFSQSTISGNVLSSSLSVVGGGIVNQSGTMRLSHCTISGNRLNPANSGGFGGGIRNSGSMILTHCTVSGNSISGGSSSSINWGGGINGNVSAHNTIIAGNTLPGNGSKRGPDVMGTLTSLGYNLIGNNADATITPTTGDKIGGGTDPVIDAKLGPLADNGGPTKTHALLEMSPALNAGGDATTLNGAITGTATSLTLNEAAAFPVGSVLLIDSEQMTVTAVTNNTLTVTRGTNNTAPASHNDGAAVNPAFDQRGFGFPRKVGSAIDIGAFEVQNNAPTLTLNTTAPSLSKGSQQTGVALGSVNDVESAVGGLQVSLTSANPSNGVTLSQFTNNNGLLAATIQAACTAGQASFTLAVQDEAGAITTAQLTVTVTQNTAPTLSYPSNPGTSFGTGLTVNPLATPSDNGSIQSFQVWSIVPALASGITVNNVGVVSVANTVPANTYTVTIRATDNCGLTKDASFTLGITRLTSVITWTPPAFLLAGPLAASVLNATANTTGTFSYTPAAGTVLAPGSVTLRANFTPDSGNYNPASQSVSLPVLDNSCGLTVNPATLPTATRGTPFVQTLSASPTGSYVFSLLSGALPPGVNLVNTLGIYSLRGTPTASGSYTFTIKAKKNNSTCEGTRTYILVIP